MESLANPGTTLMIANVSPSSEYLTETSNTLAFATKAANILGVKMKRAAPVSTQQAEITALKNDVMKWKYKCEELQARNDQLEAENAQLRGN